MFHLAPKTNISIFYHKGDQASNYIAFFILPILVFEIINDKWIALKLTLPAENNIL